MTTTDKAFFMADTTTGSVYSCLLIGRGRVVEMNPLFGNCRLELMYDDVISGIDNGIFKMVGTDY